MTQKTFSIIFCLLLAVAIAPGCNNEEEGTGADIQPGVGLKDVKIGDEAEEAINKYGPATTTYLESNGQFVHFMNYETIGIAIVLNPTNSASFDKKTTIRSFSLDAPFWGTTAEGIGIGNTKAEVKAAYNEPNTTDGITDTYTVLGISFSYDAAEKVNNIVVAKF